MASLSQGRTTAAQCSLFTHKSVPVIFEPPCIITIKGTKLFQIVSSTHSSSISSSGYNEGNNAWYSSQDIHLVTDWEIIQRYQYSVDTLLWQVYYLQVVLWVGYRRTGHNILAVNYLLFSYWITSHQIWLHSLTSFSHIFLGIYKFTTLVYYFQWHGSNVWRGMVPGP